MKGLFHVVARQRRRFKVVPVNIACEPLPRAGAHNSLLHEVRLRTPHRWCIVLQNAVNLRHPPLLNVTERFRSRQIEHENHAIRVLVVGLAQLRKAFLPAGVPDDQTDFDAVEDDGFSSVVHSEGSQVVVAESVVGEPSDKGGLSYSPVSAQRDFEPEFAGSLFGQNLHPAEPRPEALFVVLRVASLL